MRIRIIIFFVSTLVLTGCAGSNDKAEHFEALPFPEIVPPVMMDSPEERAEFLTLKWWDSLTDTSRAYPCDSSLVSGVKKGEIEQKFSNWAALLNMVSPDHARKSVSRLYDRVLACELNDTSSNVFETLTDLVVKYLYDPNSPMRNEDCYAAYAEKLAKCNLVEPELQEKYAREVRLSALNRVGTKASDFRFMDKAGKVHTLYGIKADLTLLFFSNPGCTACKGIIDVLNNDPIIARLIEDGTMAVLNIYIDEDIAAWRSYMPIYPERWYNGFDPDFIIRGETLYNVRAIPSLYLLDKEKSVLMKDAPEGRLFEWLVSRFNSNN